MDAHTDHITSLYHLMSVTLTIFFPMVLRATQISSDPAGSIKQLRKAFFFLKDFRNCVLSL